MIIYCTCARNWLGRRGVKEGEGERKTYHVCWRYTGGRATENTDLDLGRSNVLVIVTVENVVWVQLGKTVRRCWESSAVVGRDCWGSAARCHVAV